MNGLTLVNYNSHPIIFELLSVIGKCNQEFINSDKSETTSIDSINIDNNDIDKKEGTDYYLIGNALVIRDFNWGNFHFRFKDDIYLNIRKDKKYFVLKYEPLNINIWDSTIEKTIEGFKEEFAVLWRFYAKEDDINLTKKAQDLKYRLRNMVMGDLIFECIETKRC